VLQEGEKAGELARLWTGYAKEKQVNNGLMQSHYHYELAAVRASRKLERLQGEKECISTLAFSATPLTWFIEAYLLSVLRLHGVCGSLVFLRGHWILSDSAFAIRLWPSWMPSRGAGRLSEAESLPGGTEASGTPMS